MAGRFGASVEIDRPINDVFAFLADGENDKRFSERIIEIRKTTDGEPGVGTIYASKARDLGLTADHEFEITRFDPPRAIRWKELSKGPVVVAEGGYDLEPAGNGTRLSFFNELEGRGFGKLVAGFALRSAQRGAQAFADNIKATIEATE